MLKYFLYLFFIFTSIVFANDKIEIYAGSLISEDEIVKISGGVTVIYKEYILKAKEATYDKLKGDLELIDNIRVSFKKDYRILGNYAKLNIKKKEKLFKPFYMLEKSSNVWMSGDAGTAQDKDITISSGIVSGCNQTDPLWKMEFSSSDYNSQSKWINLYNTTLYIYDIPVLYTPYFGYSLDTQRRTGLLIPTIGISDKEGFYYQQPFYIALQESWDLELKPQVRTQRGYGIYSNFRFVDSKISNGNFKLGYFKEYDKYVFKEDLVNRSHYGFNFKYNNLDPLNLWIGSNFKGQSGVYIDINQMNDVDYINLAKNDAIDTNTATKILSRINLFYNIDENYFATYFKYYQDLTKESNSDTLQKLPTFHYHHYLDTFLDDYFSYNIDIKSTNIERIIDTTVVQTDIDLPITLRTSLFDELVNISYKANLYGQHSRFSGSEEDSNNIYQYNNGYFGRNYHTFSLSTELTKAFQEVIHVVSFSSRYILGGEETRTGYYSDNKDFCLNPDNINDKECEFYNITDIDEVLELDFRQYFYDFSAEEIIYHRIAQRVSYVDNRSQYGELENELNYRFSKYLSLYNNMFYNFDENSFSKIVNKLTLNNYGISFTLAHLYKDSFIEDDILRYTSYLTSTANYIYNEHYSYNFRYDYDLETEIKKSSEIGFLYEKRCWNFGLKYVEHNRPKLTQDGASSIYDKYIYITVVLKPIMSSDSDSSYGISVPDSW
ncbi:MAG: LPS-assembly protein LptD [Campylobacterota bacterium]|nr:LPS-assembly protein LptD [Campylobacterota bacterium]